MKMLTEKQLVGYIEMRIKDIVPNCGLVRVMHSGVIARIPVPRPLEYPDDPPGELLVKDVAMLNNLTIGETLIGRWGYCRELHTCAYSVNEGVL